MPPRSLRQPISADLEKDFDAPEGAAETIRLANGNTIRSRRKPRGSPCSISDRVEGCGAACSGVGSITHVRTGDTKR